MLAVAKDYITKPTFAGTITAIPLAKETNAFATALDKVQSQEKLSLSDYQKAVQSSFSKDATALVAAQPFIDSLGNLKDSLLAIKRESSVRMLSSPVTQS